MDNAINNLAEKPVAIIGGGPVGLAAAAHLALRKQAFILFETGDTVAENIKNWGHVSLFSAWKYNIDKAAEELLADIGWKAPNPEALHTAREFYDSYLLPLAHHPLLRGRILLKSRVTAISRKNMDKMKTQGRNDRPFVLHVQQPEGSRIFEARAVIDSSGTWQTPNPVGSGGLRANGEDRNKDRLYYGIPDLSGTARNRYANKNVLVVGGGHSAINTILELDKLKSEFPETQIHWVLRKENLATFFGGKSEDALPARGALGTRVEELINAERVGVYSPFQIEEIRETEGLLEIYGTQFGKRRVLKGVDEIIANTGSRPDFSFLQEVRIDADSTTDSVPALAELIDPNIHSCGTVRPHGEMELRQKEKDFYIVGMKSYGRAPTFLMATGYEQVRSVIAGLTGDWEAAKRVELNLPETGVCSSTAGEACCSTAAPEAKTAATACC